MFNDNNLRDQLEQYPESTFWLGYSGGLDSQVLLYSLANIFPATRLRAIHINHGWHSAALQWAETCQQTCAQLGVDCEVITVDAQPKGGESPEACARQARYAALAARLRSGDCLLTAHHRDDQAETFFLQLLRGAGIRGLASMPAAMPFGEGMLVRPLLQYSRSELEHYAKERELTWVEDSSNTNLRFNRNFIRHQLLPLLHRRWPEANKTLARVAQNTAEAHRLLEEVAHEDWLKVCDPSSNNLVVSRLLRLTPARRRNCLRYWLNQLCFPLPSQKQLQQIEFLLESKRDANPQVDWGGVQIRRYHDFLYALALKKTTVLPILSIDWDLRQKTLSLPLIGKLTSEQVIGQGIGCERIKGMPLNIKFRQGGERFHSQGRLGSHPLKKLFQEWKVPPWQRQTIPLLYCQDELIAVPGYGVNPNFLANKNEWGYVIRLKPI